MGLKDLAIQLGIMAKARLPKWGKQTGPGLFGDDFEQRKEHLHQEVRVDKRGRTSRRWVANEQRKERKKQAKQQQSAQPGLFDSFTMPKQAPKRKAKPEAPLFDFDFRAEKEAKEAKPAEEPQAQVNWFKPREASTPDSFPMTQDEYVAWNSGILLVGSTKVVAGVTYKLNNNHRWERVKDDETAPETPAPAEQSAQPKVTQADYDANPDRYSPSEDTGEPYGLVNDDGRTVSGPVHIVDRDRPLTVSTKAGHLPIHRKNGRLEVEGLEDATLTPIGNGDWEMRATPKAKPVVLRDNGKGNLSVVKASQLKAEAEAKPKPQPAKKDDGQLSIFDLPSEPRQAATPQPAKKPASTAPKPQPASDEDKKPAKTVFKPQATERSSGVNYDQPFTAAAQELPRFGFDLLEKATKSRRVAANQEAIALADRLIEEGRTPTAEERRTLAAYTGDGGTNGDLNAHYTPALVAGAMWRLLHRAGVTSGDVLEPSMGAGVFMETAPAGMRMHGVELSPVTQKIARLLHGDAAVHDPMPFERFHTDNPEQKFAGVVSNPPYGSRYQAIEDLDKPELKQAERYFLDTALDHLEDGGVGVFLTNPGPFESESGREFRARLLARADVLGLYQLPQSTFGESESGVPPVVAVLRKRPNELGMTLARLVEQNGEKVFEDMDMVDSDFLDGTLHLQSKNILGEFSGKTLYRGYKDIQGDVTPELLSKMTEAPLRGQHHLSQQQAFEVLEHHYGEDALANARAYANSYGAPKEGEIRDGLIFRNHRWHRINEESPELGEALKISSILRSLADVRNNGQTGDAEAMRQTAEDRLEQFLETHGNPHDHKSIKDAARHNHLLANMLTAVTKAGELAHHIVTPLKDENDFSDLVDRDDLHHVATYLHGKGRLNPELVSQLYNGADSPQEAEAALLQHPEIALTEDGRYVPANTYFHGQVHDRAASLDAAAAAEENLSRKAKYEAQAKRFREMLPKKTLEDFEVKPREKWLPTQVIEDFINQVIQPNSNNQFHVRQQDGVFWVEHRESWTPDSIEDMRKYLNYALNPDSVRDQDRMTREEIAGAKAASLEAVKRKIKRIEDQFAAWLSTSDHRDAVEEAYNRAFNSYVPETLSAAPLATEQDDSYTGHELHLFQRQNIRFMMQQGGGITALDVGLGKTPTGIALVNELHLSGKAKKPMIIVPSPLLPNWRESITKTHADASIISSADDDTQTGKRVLVIGQTYKGKRKNKDTGEMEDYWADDSGEEVARKLVRAANEDWHAVLISRDWHSRIPLRSDTWMKMVESDIQKQRDFALDEDESTNGAFKGAKRKKSKGGKTKRDQEQEKADALMKAAGKLFKGHTNPLNWEDLGIDAMLVDEAHCFPAGTLVDGKPIESYQVGDWVSAFDHATGEVTQARVTDVQATRLPTHDRLYRITLTDGQEIVSTGSHPYFTQDGYVFARDLVSGDSVYRLPIKTSTDSMGHDSAAVCPVPESPHSVQISAYPVKAGAADLLRVELHSDLQARPQDEAPDAAGQSGLRPVSAAVHPKQGAGLETPREGRDGVFLQQELPGDARAPYQPGLQSSDSSIKFAAGGRIARADRQSATTIGDTGSQSEDAGLLESQGTSAPSEGRKRSGHDSGSGRRMDSLVAAQRRGVGPGTQHQDGAAEGVGVSARVQGRPRELRAPGCRRTGRPLALIAYPEGPRPEEGSALEVIGVARVEVLEQDRPGESGSLCESGIVYNLEVETHHNYFAEGVLVHNCYKNLYSAPPTLGGKSPKFMGAGAESKRAQDFNYKSRQLREKNGGHGVYFLTATPTKNSPLEVFNMLSHITDAFNQRGIGLTEDFVDRYCEIEPMSVPQLDGTFESQPCVVGFKNLGELRGIMSQYVFRRTKDSEDVKALPGWHVPERDDIEHEIEMNPDVAAEYKGLAEAARAASQSIGGFDEGGKHVFSYLADMRKMTLDPGLYASRFAGEENPRFKKAAEIALNARKEGGKTVMFMDLGQAKGSDDDSDSRSDDDIAAAANEYNIPGRAEMRPPALRKAVQKVEEDMQGNAYDRLVEHLVKAGIPRERIAVVNGQTVKGKQERQDIKARFNAGELDVVVGSTPIIGEGFSLQKGTADMVHLDTPWEPGTYQQRLGRAQRQGNKRDRVRNHVLLAKNSFDSVTYSTMTGKQGWMQHLWEGSSDAVENTEASNNNLADLSAMLESDPEKYKELMAQRQAEAETRKADAARKLTVDGVRGYGRKLAAVNANAAQQQKMSGMIETLKGQLSNQTGERAKETQAQIDRYEGQLVKAQAKADRVRIDAESTRKQLLEDPHLTDTHRQVIESGKEFLLDEQGNPFVKGGTFMQNGTLRLISDLSTVRQAIQHRRAVPDATPGSYMNKPVATPITEVGTTSDHTLSRTDEHERFMIDGILKPHGEGHYDIIDLRRIHPDLATKHAGYLQEKLTGQPLRSQQGGLWTVKDGAAHYRPSPGGILPPAKVHDLEEGERVLLPTHDDIQLLNAALKKQGNNHRPSMDAPIMTSWSPIHQSTQVSQAPYDEVHKQHSSNHIIKADLPRGKGLAAMYRVMKGAQ